MRIDTLLPQEIDRSRTAAGELSGPGGYDGFWIGESAHDPWMQALVAAETAPTSHIGTAVVVAFARTPMTVAHSAYDLARYSRGRFVLGLGTQIKPHIERRFSMPWSRPAERMREYVTALRAIWTAWSEQTPLDFHGEFYTHDLMTPVFSPPAHEWGPPPVYVAAVGERMLQVTGEVADGLITHPFHSEDYLRRRIVPAVAEGAAAAGRRSEDVAIVASVLVATGRDDEELARSSAHVRRWLSFYSSTPAYRPVLELDGWDHIHDGLRTMSRQGRWQEMADSFPDELVDVLALVGEPKDVADRLVARYGGVADRVSLNLGP
ncbi:MAG TPA: TIGR03617 family F420-dependent LLM class oxidoreductase, partial [Pseudonocardia sp.]|nr:TIGR03617 family F420-dependent LLM class oxidoreductase [Pseudonocardia sp.]